MTKAEIAKYILLDQTCEYCFLNWEWNDTCTENINLPCDKWEKVTDSKINNSSRKSEIIRKQFLKMTKLGL